MIKKLSDKKSSRSSKEPKDVFEKLSADHREVEGVFKKILATDESQAKKRNDLFQQLNSLLSAHATAEEQAFYPRTEGSEKTKDLTLEAYEEHNLVKRLLSELEAIDAASDVWTAKVTVLSELVKHHVKEEEEELFPKAKKLIPKEEARDLASEIASIEATEMGSEKVA